MSSDIKIEATVNDGLGEVGTWADRLVVQVSHIVGWLFPTLMCCIVAQVLLRASGNNQAWLDDLQWWLYGFAALSGIAYAVTTNSHVRVDILYQNYAPEKQARIDVMGLGWFLLPFLLLTADQMFHYAVSSYVSGEGSDSPNGLHRLYLLKLSLPVLFVLAIIAAISMVQRRLNVYATPTLWRWLLAMAPFSLFAAERAVYYCLWWWVRLSQPDLSPRRISREPLLENTVLYGLILLIAVMALSFMLSRASKEDTA